MEACWNINFENRWYMRHAQCTYYIIGPSLRSQQRSLESQRSIGSWSIPCMQSQQSNKPVTIQAFLYDLFIIYNCPSIIMSDQGREFINKVISNMREAWYWSANIFCLPPSNERSIDERFNQTLIRSLQKVVETEEEWNLCINCSVCLQNFQTGLKEIHSLWASVYGRKPCLPIELETAPTQLKVCEGSGI